MASSASNLARAQTDLDIRSEEAQLRKSAADIAAGWTRLHRQENLVPLLKASGQRFEQAERLAALLRETLAEWERHHALIEQRLTYLKVRRAVQESQANPSSQARGASETAGRPRTTQMHNCGPSRNS